MPLQAPSCGYVSSLLSFVVLILSTGLPDCKYPHLSISHLTRAQVFVATTWSIIFTNNPTSLGWFPFHPPLQSFAIACFTYGTSLLARTHVPPR